MTTLKIDAADALKWDDDGCLSPTHYTVLSDVSSWVNAVAVVDTVVPDVSALVWNTQADAATNLYYAWFGNTYSVVEAYNVLSDSSSPGHDLRILKNEFDEKDRLYVKAFNLAEPTKPTENATAGYITNTYYYPQKYTWTWPTWPAGNAAISSDVNYDIKNAILLFVRYLPQAYKDEIKKALQ